MSEARYEGLKELCSRLPDVPQTVITHFLVKYGNVEECYERLKNGIEENRSEYDVFNTLSSPAPPYIQKSPTRTRSTAHDETEKWFSPNYIYENPTSTAQKYPGGQQEGSPPPHLPYPISHSRMPTHQKPNEGLSPGFTEADLIKDQKLQVAAIRQEVSLCKLSVDMLRAEVDEQIKTLTKLRVDVSDCPTNLDLTHIQDIITTLEDDILTIRKRIEIERTQSEMKKNLDLYTEEGVRWNCKGCHFLNHPLMTRCEHCDRTR